MYYVHIILIFKFVVMKYFCLANYPFSSSLEIKFKTNVLFQTKDKNKKININVKIELFIRKTTKGNNFLF